jgi:methionyl-tRNA synthetase
MIKKVSVKVKCPLCQHSLMDEENKLHGKPSIKLNIQLNEDRGVIHLCSIYDCYDHKCNIDLTEGIAEFTCPHCNQILNSTEVCNVCGANMVPLMLDVGGRVTICSRKGCKNHYVAFEDINEAVSRFYDEYGF